MSGAEIGRVVDLEIVNDVAGELALSEPMIKTLSYLADHAGEINWRRSDVKLATQQMIEQMSEQGLVREREYHNGVGIVANTLRLTDKGRNVIELHRKRAVRVGQSKAVTL